MRIVVGQGSCGVAAGAGKTYEAIRSLMTDQDTFLYSDISPGMIL